MMRLSQAGVNGGRDGDSLKAAKCLVVSLLTRVSGVTGLPLSPSTIQRNHSQGAWDDQLRKKTLLSLTLLVFSG